MRILFVNGWRFHDGEIESVLPAIKGPVYTQAKTEGYRQGPASVNYPDAPNDFGNTPGRVITHELWENVDLPHDYIVNSPIDPNGNNALGFYTYRPAWYRKHFQADESWRNKRVEIEFLGVSTECDVYFNGSYVHRNATAYTPFTVDITDFLRFDGRDNVIAVHVTQNTIENWWYNGGGITHKVYLSVKERVAVARDGVFVCPKKTGTTRWEIPIEAEIENTSYADVSVKVTTGIFDREGALRSSVTRSDVHISARSSVTVKYGIEIFDNPRLWDIDSPYLYSAVTRVYVDGAITDESKTTFGFRTLRFDANEGFFLNGRHVVLKGLCGHEDFALTGKAVPDNVMRHKVRLCKEMGANAYRCAHSMQDEAMMDAFDEYGMLVMAETRHFSSTPEHMAQLRALVKRDRNRPSVIMWSIGNEEHYFVTDEGRRIAENMTFEVKRLDTSRPVMTANDKSPEKCTVYEASDIVAVNYNPALYDDLHKKFPDKPFVVSEFSAAGGTRGWYYPDSPERGYRSIYDKDVNNWFRSHEKEYLEFLSRPWIMGAFLWSSIEYLGEAVWPRICSISGQVDLYMQKKDSFYQMKSIFTSEPMVHLLPHWNMQGMGDVKVFVYDNCASVELFLNGKSLGRQATKRCVHHEWTVPFEAGTIAAVGYDENGIPIAADERVTTGAAASLALKCENATDVCANGEDLALITCYAVDKEGREVPDAECYVSFMTDDGARIIGTGSDNADHTPPCCPDRKMVRGRALCAVLPAASGKLNVWASAPGLEGAHLTVEIPEDTDPIAGRTYSVSAGVGTV